MRIGCLFGSFDPPHNGHIAIAEHMLRAQGLDAVWLLVTPLNPFKQHRGLTADELRWAMACFAVEGHQGLEASRFEFGLPRPSYTASTLQAMRSQWPEHRFSLIIGSDNLAALHRWKDPETILAHHEVLVYPRPGFEEHLRLAELGAQPAVRIVPDAPLLDISSTAIRAALREGRSTHGALAPAVAAFIAREGLYRS